jgi:hypothetical protein
MIDMGDDGDIAESLDTEHWIKRRVIPGGADYRDDGL